ncbi:hypothetical protein ACLB2K_035462 [Fragaria x ananassa]
MSSYAVHGFFLSQVAIEKELKQASFFCNKYDSYLLEPVLSAIVTKLASNYNILFLNTTTKYTLKGDVVWSLVRRFDQPQKYKPFVSRCVVQGNLKIGSLRVVDVKSGLPATTITERLELVDDDEHLLSIKIIGGDHRLRNYSSIISLHPEIVDGRPGTVVIESFVVDVPDGNTKDETCYFVEAVIQCNLKSLCDVSERLAAQDHTEPIDRL